VKENGVALVFVPEELKENINI